MNKDIKIVFMGTPEFAVTTLKTILDQDYNVVGVITAPDKPAGRGRKMHESAVKVFAKQKGLNILQPTNLKSDDFLNELKALEANLQIIVAFRMLPKVVWDMPKYGTFNLHASLLPNYRGAAPINWAIINGETKTGVSTFFIDEKIDTGEMILQKDIAIDPSENAGSLHDKLMMLGSDLIIDTIKLIEKGDVTTTPQSEDAISRTAYKLNRDNCKIDFTQPIEAIYNKIRGLSPYPAAWCELHNNDDVLDIKIYKAEKEFEDHNIEVGTIISNKSTLKVAVKEGFITILELKLPGKRNMEVKSLLNGYNFDEDAKLR
ncbi:MULTISPECIES: methionyl-tRNA formyltransferase [unclassified Olleya]|jgi:methionyl-tRNA formyltransferase|uniref:methionyl-tRNA formyltransferase n=1 Tax=unclassified Olleya TaxID=2615019 RepID=UPI0011A643B2|nr:methionyl-tRNA formyltransferase [Olleya sp. Hel_I_94]TVZ46902.1 methionyl-tRNA formyltransferase [Olleya sp. Hel_I_94]